MRLTRATPKNIDEKKSAGQKEVKYTHTEDKHGSSSVSKRGDEEREEERQIYRERRMAQRD